MKRLYLHLIIIGSLMCATDGSARKITNQGRAHLGRMEMQRRNMVSTNGTETTTRIKAIVSLHEGYTTDVLRQHGIEPVVDLGDMATVSVDRAMLDSLENIEQVKSISVGGRKRLKMDYARAASGVAAAHSGTGPADNVMPYTGKGVIVGLMDGGLEANHINFKNSDGTTRVERLWNFTDDYGTSKEYTSSTVGSFTSDDTYETHATHVAGIMGGGHRGTVTYYHVDTADGFEQTEMSGANPYYGVAYESSLAFSVGSLSNDNIIQGVENIVNYAEAQGKPAAINLSLGSNSGPHDGTDDFSQALDRLGQRAIICVAAGNEGEDKMSIEKTFTSTDREVKSALYYNNQLATSIDGYLDIWASDDLPVTVTLVAVNTRSNNAETTLGTISAANKEVSISSKTGMSSGSITMYSAVDPNNDRFNVLIDCYTLKMRGGYRLGVKVKGEAGQKVNLYFDGYSEFLSQDIPGYVDGTPDQSINGMACGENVIATGAYTTRTSWGTISGDVYGYNEGFDVGTISSFSSYGTLPDGTTLPTVAAPGAGIVSSYSRYYVSNESESPYMTAKLTSGGTTYYWGEMEGTSMATPYMTGTAALWLQADPTLTCADIKEVLANSCKSDAQTAATPDRFGYGKLDANAGLMYILTKELGAIGDVESDMESPLVVNTVAEGVYTVALAGNSSFTVSLTDMQGRTVATATATDGMATIDASSLGHGIYVLRAAGNRSSATMKLAR